MSTLAKLVVELGLDSSQFSSGIANAQRQASGLSNVLQSAAGTALGFATAMIGTRVIGGAFNMIKDSAIGMNATLETSTLQFQTLMGSADQATQHVKGLFQFAKDTPFETAPIIQASQTLQVFGGSVLNTQDYLRLFGDAAAATQAPLERLTFWSGRLYSALQSGKPLEGVINPLLEMGAIGPHVANQLEAMARAGKSADEVWKVFSDNLTRFSGAMKLQAGTWQGLTSSISDSAKMLVATAFRPLFDEAKKALQGILGFLGRLEASGAAERFAEGLQFVIAVLKQFGSQVVNYAKAAYNWGQNIATQFAAGIAAAVSAVVRVLQQLGSIIAHWLQPGSPPRITPNLDEWGAQAATVYIEGWANADFSAFEDLSRSIESILKGLVDTKQFDQRGVIPTLLAGREGLAAGLSEIAKVGQVSQATFDRIIASVGPAATAVSPLVRAYFDLSAATRRLKQAQDELNSTTQKYSDMLAPLNAQMEQLQDQAQHIRNLQRIEELNEILADGESTALDKELAANELQQIALQENIDGIENERDAALEAAQAKVDAAAKEEQVAKDRVDAQKALIDTANQTNQLLGEQARLLEQLAKSSAASGGGGAGKGAGGMPDLASMTAGVTAPISGISTAAADAKAKLDSITASAQAFVANITTRFEAAKNSVINFLAPLNGVVTALQGLFSGQIPIDQFIGTMLTKITELRDRLLQAITGMLPQVLTAFGQLAAPAADWIIDAIPGLLGNVSVFVLSLINQLLTYIPQIAATFVQFGVKAVMWLSERAPEMVNNVGLFFNGLINTLLDNLPRWADNLRVFAEKAATWILDALPQLGANLGKATGVLLGWIITTTADVVPKLLVLGLRFVNWVVTDVIPKLPGTLLTIATAIYNFIANLVTEVAPKLKLVAERFLNWIQNDVLPYLRGKLDAINTEIGRWVAEKAVWAAIELQKIGKAIVQGIQDGISAMWGRFTSWIQDRINEIPQVVRDVLGIGSPSKVAADLALNFVQTFGNVFNSAWKSVAASASEKTKEFVAQFTSNLAEIGRGVLNALKTIQSLGAKVDSGALDQARKRGEDLSTQWSATTAQLNDVNKEIDRVAAKQATTADEQRAKQAQLNELYAERNKLIEEQARIENERKVAASEYRAAEEENAKRQSAVNKVAEEATKQYSDLQAQVAALAQTDASAAAELYKRRSAQIAEMADLKKQLALATDQTEIDNLKAQIALLEEVQGLETSAAESAAVVNVDARGSFGIEDFVDMIQAALADAGINVDIRARMA